jgi:hypothetical protein
MNIKNLSTLIIISLFAVVLSACTTSSSDNQTQSQNMVQDQKQLQESQTVSGTIKDLMGLDQAVKCTFENPDGQGRGTVYAQGSKAKTEIEIDMDGQKISMNTLVDGEWMYQWGNSMMGNTKMNIKEMEKLGEQYQEQNRERNQEPEQVQNYNQELNYNCSPWNGDSSVFSLPSGVEFTDTTKQLTDTINNAENMKQDLCKMCESLPGEAKTECLSSCK